MYKIKCLRLGSVFRCSVTIKTKSEAVLKKIQNCFKKTPAYSRKNRKKAAEKPARFWSDVTKKNGVFFCQTDRRPPSWVRSKKKKTKKNEKADKANKKKTSEFKGSRTQAAPQFRRGGIAGGRRAAKDDRSLGGRDAAEGFFFRQFFSGGKKKGAPPGKPVGEEHEATSRPAPQETAKRPAKGRRRLRLHRKGLLPPPSLGTTKNGGTMDSVGRFARPQFRPVAASPRSRNLTGRTKQCRPTAKNRTESFASGLFFGLSVDHHENRIRQGGGWGMEGKAKHKKKKK